MEIKDDQHIEICKRIVSFMGRSEKLAEVAKDFKEVFDNADTIRRKDVQETKNLIRSRLTTIERMAVVKLDMLAVKLAKLVEDHFTAESFDDPVMFKEAIRLSLNYLRLYLVHSVKGELKFTEKEIAECNDDAFLSVRVGIRGDKDLVMEDLEKERTFTNVLLENLILAKEKCEA